VIATRPRLGFLGVGWIGAQRLEAVRDAGAAEVIALADADPARAAAVAGASGPARVCGDLDGLLAQELDGVVIATPTAQHAAQAARALEAGLPVFCQKPLGRTGAETRGVIDLARRRGLRLGVDMSYRYTVAVRAAEQALRDGRLGAPHAAELVFHNAYGPARSWSGDVTLAGGGALVDLGWHLIDLAAMLLGPLDPLAVHADLFAGGRRLGPDPGEVEDLALAQLTLSAGRALRLACSWHRAAGLDSVIEATVLDGEGRAVSVRNVAGSFHDLEAVLLEGSRSETLAAPPDAWGGRALVAWARALGAEGPGFDPAVERLGEVADVIDAIYGRPR
jgi:predicted dehydrogenase